MTVRLPFVTGGLTQLRLSPRVLCLDSYVFLRF